LNDVDGMIDANELSTVMNILKLPITDREANEMIEYADHDKGNRFIFISLTINLSKRFSNIFR
jgi:Ca2+-binding EF-hand superfamily protein